MAERADGGVPPSALVFRYVIHERFRTRVPPGARVLNLGCGAGGDALMFASYGVSVLGLDLSTRAVQQARRRTLAAGLGNRLRFQVRQPWELRLEDGSFDGVLSGIGALEWGELPEVGRALAAVLRPDAPVALSLAAPTPAAARYGARQEAERLLGPEFAWSAGYGVGIFLPAPSRDGWAERHPQVFAALAGLESLVRDWPVMRDLGAHLVLVGVRR
jgi:SAM-dependent methyltransferase